MRHRAVLLALVFALAACDSLLSPTQYPDSVLVAASGVPNDLEHEITLTTPAGLPLTVKVGERIPDAAPGEYRLAADPLEYGVTTFTAARASVTGTLVAGRSLTLRAEYAADRDVMQAAVDRLNEHRSAAGVAPVVGDAEGSLPQWLHVRYAASNGTTGHFEDPSLPWYTPEGHEAARRSNLAYGSVFRDADYREPSNGRMWVDVWAQAPYHMFSLMDPRTTSVRFAWFQAESSGLGSRSAAAMQPIRTAGWGDAIVRYPGANAPAEVGVFRGENPSPLDNCPGYEGPTGIPVFFMTGPSSDPPRISGTTLTRDGAPVEHCAYDAYTDRNRSAYPHLRSYGAAVLIPRQPLEPSSTYRVRFETSRGVIEWSFRTAGVLIQAAPGLAID